MVKAHTLDNGLKVVTLGMPSVSSVSIGLWIKAGVRNEHKDINGISHILEHLVFKGTKRRSAEKLKHDIEGRGGSLNGFTAEEFACYLVKVLGKEAQLGIDVLSDMVFRALLKPADVEKEKRVVVEEINMYKDMPAHYVHELLTEILWPAHPLGFPLAGTVESVNGLTRSGIMEYKETYYTPSNMVVMACGNLKDAKIVKICERYFSKGFKKTAPQAHPAPRRPAPKPSTLVRYKKTEQTHLAIGLHASSRFHPDRYVLSLLNVVLGANMSSRLFQEARERRALCYEIGSSIRRYRDAGAFIIGAGVDCAKLPKALEVIFNELRKLKVRPVPKDELERAKEFYKGQLHLTIEETMSAMLWFGEKVSSGERDLDVKGILAKVDSISAQDLMKTASETFRDTNLNVAVIGPIEDEERVEEVSHIR